MEILTEHYILSLNKLSLLHSNSYFMLV